ncbi:ATP-grasp domain-containing protein [Saccharopolyspora rectivirgula]|uniref:Biotin carboxylase n=1 Tax=Saccharopolyspora rectivirgula TaxID=28042 RepID=A0A073BB36_9PSEU|nr:ATP-grasp domain-containing protein [Saccharopolyspora rectivirgula]KEI44994.1 biotin carboxylase [Saccharopolyspora rectivirgula]
MADQTRNVFVLGLDDRNLALMQNLPNASSLRFHRLLTREELMYVEAPVGELLDRARDELNSFDSTIDAIVGYWDFPVSSMVPVLCREYGLPGPSLEAVLKCEHKYWSRIEQRKVALSFPPFELVSLENDPEPPRLNYPYWLKPVKSYSSAFAYKISSAEQFHQAAQEIRTGMEYIGEAFDHFLDQAEVPAEVAAAGGSACLAEEQVSGQQITAEGYSYRGRPHVYGIIDSICYPDTPSFLRYQYPTQLPGEIVQRVTDVSCRVIKQIGLDNSAFNIEFFWDGERDRINILEINPRISQSHAPLFTYVDGVPNHHCVVRVALGEDPHMPRQRGEHRSAAKWFWRTFSDGVAERVPSAEDVQRVQEEVPSAVVDIIAERDRRLSELPAQDSYSYELAAIYLGAPDQEQLRTKYQKCRELLPFEIK